MPKHVFTDEERARGHEARRKNKSEKIYDTVRQMYDFIPEDDWPKFIWMHMCVSAVGIRTGDNISLGYARTILPYIYPRLRAVEQNTDTGEAINLYEKMKEHHNEKYGDVWNDDKD